MLRESVRDQFSGSPEERAGRGGSRVPRGDAGAAGVSRGALRRPRPLPGPGAESPRKSERRRCPGLEARTDLAAGPLGMASGLESFDHVVPAILGAALVGGLSAALLAASLGRFPRGACPTWGCGGVLGPRTEYTATAFSKPLMMIFRAVYRPTREVEALADVSPYFPREVRYRSHDRADVRALRLPSAAPRGAASGGRDEGAAGGKPSRLPRVRDRARGEPGAPGLVAKLSPTELVSFGVPAAIVLRGATVGATLALSRRAGACRVAAMGGSILASLVTLAVALQVIVSGRSVDGVLMRHAASGIVLGYSVTPLSAWFLMVLGLIAAPVAFYSVGYLGHAIEASRTAVVGASFNLLLGAVEVVFVADGVILFLFAWELMTLLTAALVATEHEDPTSRRAAYLYLVMSHVGTGCLVAGFLIAGRRRGLDVVSGDARGRLRLGTDARRALRALLSRIRREGRRDPSPRVAPRSPSGGADERLRPHVRRARHRGNLRPLSGLRLRPRSSGCELGPRVHGGGHALGHPRRPVRARPDRSEAPPRLQHHRERGNHRSGIGRFDDGPRPPECRARRRGRWPRASCTS